MEDKESVNYTRTSLSKMVVKDGLSESDIVKYLNVQTYFDLMSVPFPKDIHGIVEHLKSKNLVADSYSGLAITKLGAIMLAKDLHDFDILHRKMLRIIVYKDQSKLETVREYDGPSQGYALGLDVWFNWIRGQIPSYQDCTNAIRKDITAYPALSIRELTTNCLIHQDFDEPGCPTVAIYSDRMEFSNPGTPLIGSDHFMDDKRSRNEDLSRLMHLMGFCEDAGLGIDRTIENNEQYKLPPLEIQVKESQTLVRMRSFIPVTELTSMERRMVCYRHVCSKYASGEKMTPQSLRERFGIEKKSSSIVSRIIKDSINANLIKEEVTENKPLKNKSYIPFWA